MSTLIVRGPCTVTGTARVPGDKSISHRALMLGAAARGSSSIQNLASGADVASTIACLRGYGVEIESANGATLVRGKGMGSWIEPSEVLDCGNSGTTMRMLAGFAAHYGFASVLDGDASLRRRPMDRVARPLRALGAHVECEGDRFPPVRIAGGALVAADVAIEVASAQVKSCVLFAGLGADGRTVVTEPTLTRDHTERLLKALGAPISQHRTEGGACRIEIERFAPNSFEITVPGDVSSAAFLIGAGVLCGGISMDDVGLNPTRTGFASLLERMGAKVRLDPSSEQLGEPVGGIEATPSGLVGIDVAPEEVPPVLDELPLLGVLATQAEGETSVKGATELRVKESDRIDSLVTGLRKLGAEIHELPDGFVVRGKRVLRGAEVDAAGDHRIAMAMAVAGLVAHGETRVTGWECAGVSWPGFERVLADLGADVELI